MRNYRWNLIPNQAKQVGRERPAPKPSPASEETIIKASQIASMVCRTCPDLVTSPAAVEKIRRAALDTLLKFPTKEAP